ncbi:hypothetical protein SERLA73DRAFT_72489 [Serpula lacrymans var. lacrymans S7.3]|uniref:Uncharacterized protein n=2 Tax=Serpula lacrymans var. lacrymans TaxID=341189 RepID=F8PUH1_SERL3|nr:uncharacterized protein SERLADRAFT_437009 [Serpula lacrymans var. lacrymans S7.9]EGN99691.1 hypothetical protein SERLA73DRAFT_72489 [Serpula lacrymans var. lacrymans S7.3]EGO25250.1 hypothetical protein SERLADRAFT_437009 [Serpula lacrymans var. lacrymans S7.9]
MERVSQLSLSSAPRLVWHSYLDLLWAYHPDSGVARLAYSFRILAVLLVLPVIVLTLLVCFTLYLLSFLSFKSPLPSPPSHSPYPRMSIYNTPCHRIHSIHPHTPLIHFFRPSTTLQDITSYVIARTLGVVDVVKVSTTAQLPHPHLYLHHPPSSASLSASTSASMSASAPSTPIVLVEDVSLSPSFSEDVPSADEQGVLGRLSPRRGVRDDGGAEEEARPETFFASEDGSQLSGVGVFSPAASQPPSPVQSRAKLHHQDPTVESVREEGDERVDRGITLRRRAGRQQQGANDDDEKDES